MHYVAGFLFRNHLTEVALVLKKRPDYLAGMLNGIGGGVERGETPQQAMVREIYEEAGITSQYSDWRRFVTLVTARGDRIDFFTESWHPEMGELQSLIDEPIRWHSVNGLVDGRQLYPNLQYLIPMAQGWIGGPKTNPLTIVESLP